MRRENEDLISIVVPVYNVEKYIRKCIKSILAQTYKAIELILVNDGSTDSSLDICMEYKNDSRVRIYDNKNAGLSATRQFGFERATGEYICSFDSDDYLAETMLETMHEHIKQYNADICVCGRVDFNEMGMEWKVPLVAECQVIDLKHTIEKQYYDVAKRVVASDTWNKLYRMEFIKETGIKFGMPKGMNGTDSLFNYQLLLHDPKYVLLNEELYYHRIVEGSLAHRKGKKLQQVFQKIIGEVIKEAKKIGFQDDLGVWQYVGQLYYELTFSAAADECSECGTYKEMRQCMQKLVRNHLLFFEQLQELEVVGISSYPKETIQKIKMLDNKSGRMLTNYFYFVYKMSSLKRTLIRRKK